jgi:putative PIN family toxin of toxin-antitoxin system
VNPVVLLDTNVWVSALLNRSGAPARIVRLWLDGWIEVVIALHILEEIGDVLRRPRIKRKYHLREDEVVTYLRLIAAGAAMVNTAGTVRLCRDPDDDALLEAAIVGQAAYLVTRDDDLKRDPALLRHMKAHGVQVVSVSQFLATVAS